MDFSVNEADLAPLTKWDTPTICNALELVCPERRGFGFTTKHLFSLDPSLPPVCGFARTATIRAALPSGESDAEMAKKRSAYYEYVAKAPGPKIAVIQDIDPEPGIGAFWGEVQTNIHKGLGAVGAVTNGSFRDVLDSARDFNLIGGKAEPIKLAWMYMSLPVGIVFLISVNIELILRNFLSNFTKLELPEDLDKQKLETQ